MLSDQSFDHFYANISRKSKGLLGKPTLPRKRCTSATPKLPKITLEGSIIRLLILSSVLSIRKASAPTPRWRPSRLKLLMVTTMRQSSSFWIHHTEKMLIQGRYLGMQLSILEVMYRSNRSFNMPPPRAYPGHLTPLPSRGGGNLIIRVFQGVGNLIPML